MTGDNSSTVVKRVKPYPMAATIQVDGKAVKVLIVYISTKGFIARTPGLILKVGLICDVSVEVPVLHHWVRATVRVFKTYDRAVDANASAVERLAEFLFTDLASADAKQIDRFTKAIGQK